MQFLAGMLAGAVLGVVADRTWRHFELLPRLRISHGYFENIKREKGYSYTIENTGQAEIPPFQIALFHPDRGSLMVFNPPMNEVIRPGQRAEFQCVVIKEGAVRSPFLHWFEKAKGKPADKILDDGYVLRLQMAKSDYIIYQSKRNGNALARLLYRGLKEGKVGDETWEECLAMRGDTTAIVRRLIRNYKEKRSLHLLEAEGTHVSLR